MTEQAEPWGMRSILVAFGSLGEAYAFVAEIRRRADTLLWDVRVRRSGTGAVVVVPDRVWHHDSFVRGLAERFGGAVRDDERRRERGVPRDRAG